MEDSGLSSGFIASLFKPSALLPIAKYREALLYTVETYSVTILIGQTGSGKTTQLPQFLDQGGWCNDGKVVAVTQVGESSFLIETQRPLTSDSLEGLPRHQWLHE